MTNQEKENILLSIDKINDIVENSTTDKLQVENNRLRQENKILVNENGYVIQLLEKWVANYGRRDEEFSPLVDLKDEN